VPTLTFRLPEGATLTWDGAPIAMDAQIQQDFSPVVAPGTATVAPEALGATVRPEDVTVALNSIPPKWTATAFRFVKTLAAAGVAAFMATGGTVEGVFRDPTAFFTAIGTAIFMAVQKFVSWKD
jgi:hypothetical protein